MSLRGWVSPGSLESCFYSFLFKNTYLAVSRCQWQHAGSLVAARELSVSTCGICFSDQELNLGPLHWEHGVLATEIPGKSHNYFMKQNSCTSLWLKANHGLL